jgi:hypothetical protein
MKLKQITTMKYVAQIITLTIACSAFASSPAPKPPDPETMMTWEKVVASLKVKGQLRH